MLSGSYVISNMNQVQWMNICCNPFNKVGHSSKKKNLRPVLPWMIEKFPFLVPEAKICDSCRKQLAVESNPVNDSDDEIDSSYVCQQESLKSINQCLQAIGETPVSKKKLVQASYPKEKLNKIKVAAAKAILPSMTPTEIDNDSEIIEQLKEKFHSSTDRSQKVQILTVLPKSWSIRKAEEEFAASNYMARKAKDLVKDQEILSPPNPKHGSSHYHKQLTISLVQAFYELDEVSQIMPDKKDFICIRKGNQCVHVQKRLMLGNLKEVYQQFKEKHPTDKIGFSKFADLRPKHCILAGASGTHTVCVCTIHQNVTFMMIGGKIAELSAHDDIPLKEYNHCLAKIIYHPPQPDCYFINCNSCPGVTGLKDHLYALMDENMIDTIQYKQWVFTNRSTLETITKPAYEFVESFCEQLKLLLTHSFITKQQSLFQTESKLNLQPGVFQVIADFSENYSFVLQDEAQEFHWNNS